MLYLLIKILIDERGGLGITQASIVSAVCDTTGDDSSDAITKVRRLINEKGPGFCLITNWPFLRTDTSFSISSSNYIYSGASYIPASFKRVLGAFILDSNSKRYPLTEVSIKEAYEWANPNDNEGRPDEFCITRNESGYYEIQFNRLPDSSYTTYFEIEQKWANLTHATAESIITSDYYEVFSQFVSQARARQQGDLELYTILKSEWYDARNPESTVLGRALISLKSPLRRKRVTPVQTSPTKSDYN